MSRWNYNGSRFVNSQPGRLKLPEFAEGMATSRTTRCRRDSEASPSCWPVLSSAASVRRANAVRPAASGCSACPCVAITARPHSWPRTPPHKAPRRKILSASGCAIVTLVKGPGISLGTTHINCRAENPVATAGPRPACPGCVDANASLRPCVTIPVQMPIRNWCGANPVSG